MKNEANDGKSGEQMPLVQKSVSKEEPPKPPPSVGGVLGSEDVPDGELGDDQEFFIPIHDFIRFNEEEIQVINHPAFQRLGKIYQLGQANLVFRGATHKRIEHTMGTVWIAQKIANALRASYNRCQKKGLGDRTRCPYASPLSLTEIRFVRLAALLHDIGHLPAGHTLEDELGLLEPHDADQRLNLVFRKTDWIPGEESSRLGELVDTLYSKYIAPGNPTVTPQSIVRRLISKDEKVADNTVAGIRVGVCRDIVGNTICADLLDYLHRDWYHIGKPRFFDRRLFEYMEIRCDARNNSPQLVISYGQRSRPKRDAISSILELLESRYNLGESVLFHPTKCSAAAMLERAIGELYAAVPGNEQDRWLKDLENRLLAHSDEEMISAFLKECEKRKCQAGIVLLQCLAGRKIYKSVEVVYGDDLDAVQEQMIDHHYLGYPAENRRDRSSAKPSINIERKRDAAKKRLTALAAFEKEFKLDPGSLVMYCPTRAMNLKIAQVKVVHNDAIRTLDEWDRDAQFQLAGGHCAAQLERFESLWRVEVFLRETDFRKLQPKGEKRETEYFRTFKKAVKAFILGVAAEGNTLPEEAHAIVTSLATIAGSPYFGRKALELAANRFFDAADSYPLGAPLIRTLLVPDEGR